MFFVFEKINYERWRNMNKNIGIAHKCYKIFRSIYLQKIWSKVHFHAPHFNRPTAVDRPRTKSQFNHILKTRYTVGLQNIFKFHQSNATFMDLRFDNYSKLYSEIAITNTIFINITLKIINNLIKMHRFSFSYCEDKHNEVHHRFTF